VVSQPPIFTTNTLNDRELVQRVETAVTILSRNPTSKVVANFDLDRDDFIQPQQNQVSGDNHYDSFVRVSAFDFPNPQVSSSNQLYEEPSRYSGPPLLKNSVSNQKREVPLEKVTGDQLVSFYNSPSDLQMASPSWTKDAPGTTVSTRFNLSPPTDLRAAKALTEYSLSQWVDSIKGNLDDYGNQTFLSVITQVEGDGNDQSVY